MNLPVRDSQGQVRLPWSEFARDFLELYDLLKGEVYVKDDRKLLEAGLFVVLGPRKFHLFAFHQT